MRASVLKRYPELRENDVIFQQVDDVVFLHVWNSSKPKPTMEQIKTWVEEDSQLPKPKTEVETLKQENTELLKRVEEAENAIMTLMDMSLL